jgi:hypothetical protein
MPIDKSALLESLEEAKYTGALKITYQDRTIVYRNLAELNQTIAELKRDLGLLPGGPRRKVISTDKGLGGETAGTI